MFIFQWQWEKDLRISFEDKNPDQVAEAKQRFLEIRAAYEVLSDSHERAWYDAHRDVMLQKASGGDYQDDTINIYPYFTSSCYQGYNDSENVSNHHNFSFLNIDFPGFLYSLSSIIQRHSWTGFERFNR